MRRLLLPLLVLLCMTGQAQTDQRFLEIGIDADNDPQTGCDWTLENGSTVSGVEILFQTTYETGADPRVVTTSYRRCSQGGFGAASTIDGGWSIGSNVGDGGADAIEAALPLSQLGVTGEVRLVVQTRSDLESDVLAMTAQGDEIVFNLPLPIPTLQTWFLLFFLAALLIIGLIIIRRGKSGPGTRGTLLALAALLLVGLNATIILDGQVGDWSGDPIATDPAGDTAELTIDIVSFYVCQGDDDLFFRIDILEAENQMPTADDQSLTVLEDGSLPITLTATDPDGEPLTFEIVDTPTNGALGTLNPTGNDTATITYTPNADYFGNDSFTFRVTDGVLFSTPATISITVDAVNDIPSFTPGSDVVVNEDSGPQREPLPRLLPWASNLSAGPANESSQVLSFNITNNTNPGLFSALPTVDGTSGDLSFTPAADLFGSATITLVLMDDGGVLNGGVDTTAPVSFTITVVSVNDVPTANNDTFTVDEDSVAQSLDVLANDSPAPDSGETLTITVVGTPDQGGSVVIAGAGTSLSYTPAGDFFGVESFDYTISDGNGGVATAMVTVTVNNVNDPVTANNDGAYATDEDTILTADPARNVLNNDLAPDGGLVVQAASIGSALGATITLNPDGTFIYDPTISATLQALAQGAMMTDSFDYTAEDTDGDTAVGTVTIDVTGVNDPVVTTADSYTTDEETALPVDAGRNLLDNDDAPDGGLVVSASDATSAQGIAVTVMADGTFAYDQTGSGTFQALDDGESLTDTFGYTAQDVDGDTDTNTVSITVNGINDAPVANNQSQQLQQGMSLLLTLTGSDMDVEDLTFNVVTGPTNGSLSAITSTGATSAEVTYTHDNSMTSSDSFTFTVNDGTVDSAPATVSFTLNDPPVANDDGMGSPIVVQQNTNLDIDVAANDTDSDGTLDLTSIVPTNGSRGTTMAVAGQVRYSPNLNEQGMDVFTYTIDDNEGATSNVANVTVFINAPPTADDDMFALAEASGSTNLAVLTGDTDSDGTLVVTSVTITTDVPGGEGTTMVNPDGTVAYDPGTFVGTTSFQYTVEDNLGGVSNIATVTIMVDPNPAAIDDAYTVIGHTTVSVPASIGLLDNDTDDGSITAIAGTFATDQGGSITIAADGSFTYTTPGPGVATPPSVGGTDTYTYTIQDGAMGMDTGVITFTYEEVVWFVNNTSVTGTDDGTIADPFNTLAEAVTASEPDETIFIYEGDGTSTNLDTGVVLQNGQQLFGEPQGLSVDVDGMGPHPPIELVASGLNKPVITNTVGDVPAPAQLLLTTELLVVIV